MRHDQLRTTVRSPFCHALRKTVSFKPTGNRISQHGQTEIPDVSPGDQVPRLSSSHVETSLSTAICRTASCPRPSFHEPNTTFASQHQHQQCLLPTPLPPPPTTKTGLSMGLPQRDCKQSNTNTKERLLPTPTTYVSAGVVGVRDGLDLLELWLGAVRQQRPRLLGGQVGLAPVLRGRHDRLDVALVLTNTPPPPPPSSTTTTTATVPHTQRNEAAERRGSDRAR